MDFCESSSSDFISYLTSRPSCGLNIATGLFTTKETKMSYHCEKYLKGPFISTLSCILPRGYWTYSGLQSLVLQTDFLKEIRMNADAPFHRSASSLVRRRRLKAAVDVFVLSSILSLATCSCPSPMCMSASRSAQIPLYFSMA